MTRMMKIGALLLAALATTGCSQKVRAISAMHWRFQVKEGAKDNLYATYWEGSCSSGFAGMGRGCDAGDSHVRRCSLNPDNSMTCVEEADANRALSKEQK